MQQVSYLAEVIVIYSPHIFLKLIFLAGNYQNDILILLKKQNTLIIIASFFSSMLRAGSIKNDLRMYIKIACSVINVEQILNT